MKSFYLDALARFLYNKFTKCIRAWFKQFLIKQLKTSSSVTMEIHKILRNNVKDKNDSEINFKHRRKTSYCNNYSFLLLEGSLVSLSCP